MGEELARKRSVLVTMTRQLAEVTLRSVGGGPVTLQHAQHGSWTFPSRAALDGHFAKAGTSQRRMWLESGRHRVRRATAAEVKAMHRHEDLVRKARAN